MGFIKAGVGALGGTLADQWREFFYCESMNAETLVTKGDKRVSSNGRSSNIHGEENIISNGSTLAVNDGQCAIIVENGMIVDVCAEPGEFVYDTSIQPSFLYGPLGEGIKGSFLQFGKRFTYGGDTGADQRIYFFNTKEIVGNRYGTVQPIPFRIVDKNIGLDLDTSLRCNGQYSYRLADPILFYKNVCGNVAEDYMKDKIAEQMRSELLTALQPTFASLSAQGIRYSAIPGYTKELTTLLNNELSEIWGKLRGIKIVSFGINSLTMSPEDEERLKELQRTAVNRDSGMAAASIVTAQSDAMRSAAANESGMGAMGAFIGMGMANMAGGVNASALGNVEGSSPTSPYNQAENGGFPQGAQVARSWTCECGTANTGNFCQNCGKPKHQSNTWTCECGQENAGNFCSNCGKPKPQNDS